MYKAGIWSRTSGFTLIELSLVILLIGLFSMLTVPMITGIGQDGLRASARRIAGTAKYFYNESVLTGREYRLVFDLEGRTFGAKALEDTGELVAETGIGRTRELARGARFQDIAVAGRGTFTTGEIIANIHPAGWLEETVIHLKNEDGDILTLRLMPFTGSTEMYDGYREFF